MKIELVILCFLFSLTLVSCEKRIVPLKYAYQQDAYEFKTNYNREKTWDQLIDLFTKEGLAIKTIDKVDGIITTEKTSFLNSYTWENKHGTLICSDARVVCGRYRGTFTLGPSFRPGTLTGQWVVRINEDGGATAVVIKLANASAEIFAASATSNQAAEYWSPYVLQVRHRSI